MADPREITHPDGAVEHPDGSTSVPAGHEGPLPPARGQDHPGRDLPVALSRTRGPRGASRPQGGPR